MRYRFRHRDPKSDQATVRSYPLPIPAVMYNKRK